MKERRLIYLALVFLVVVVGTVVIITNAYIEPLTPLNVVFRKNWLFLLMTAVVLTLIFRIIDYYYQQLQSQIKRLETLHETNLKLTSDLKMDYRCSEALAILMGFYRGKQGVLFITDERLKKYVSTEVFSILKGTSEKPKHANYRYQTFSPGKVPADFQSKIDSIIKEYNFYAFPSIVLVPFFTGENTVAIAIIGTGETDKKFFEGLKYVIDIFIKQVVTSFDNSLLHEEVNEASITDPLTKLYNRRYFNARTKEKFTEARRMGYPVSLMISDLDNFKQYVDKYGHPKGDIILSEVGRLAAEAVRETDIVCRFGGDELAYLLPFASSLEARTVAERLRKKVSAFPFLEKETKDKDLIHLTLSIGIACFPENGDTEEDVLRCADQALFYAKERGKDKIHIFKKQGVEK